MSETYSPVSIKALADADLEALYAAAEDDALIVLAVAEMTRRERCARERAIRHAVNAEWFLAAHAQYLQAEAACRGNLLSRAGIKAGIDPWSLWSGPAGRADKYASEELRDFWLYASPRVTVCQYAAQLRRAQRAAAEK
jgi:hypothetical protein